ncbi:MAG TPA: hypothetical protein V6D07_15310 [Trichocoleus sp.]
MIQLTPHSRIFRGAGLILCLMTVSTSGLIVQPKAATALMLSQATAPSAALDCSAVRQQNATSATNNAVERAEYAVRNGRVDQAAQLLTAYLRDVQAMKDSPDKLYILQQLVGSMGEDMAYLSVLERLVQAVPAQNPEAALSVLATAVEVTQGVSSSYSAAKTRTLVMLAEHYTQLGQMDQSSRILAEALSASNAIQGADFKTSALSSIAETYIKAERADLALPILAQSLQVAKTIEKPNPYQRAGAIERIASLYAQIDQIDLALQTVRLIEISGYPSNALLTVIDKYSQAGQFDRALEVLPTVGPEQKALGLAIVAGRATAQQPQRAVQLYAEAVATARSAQTPNLALVKVALRHAESGGLVATADQTVQTVNDPVVQAPALGEIALLYAKAGQEDQGEARLTQAIETLGAIPDDGNRNAIRQQLIDRAAQRGRYDYALKLAATIQPGEDSFDRVDVLTRLAEQALKIERYDAALQVTEQIPPSFASWRERLFPQIARGFVKSGDLDRALAIAQQENVNPGFRPRILAVIAAQLAQSGQAEQSSALFNQATQLANSIDDIYARTEVLGAIAQAYLDAGQSEQATQRLDQAIQTTQAIQDVSSRSYFLRTIADQLTSANDYSAAIRVAEAIPDDSERLAEINKALEQAILAEDLTTVQDVVGRLEDPVFKTRWLVTVADNYSYLNQPEAATRILSQALQIARTIPGDESKTVTVRGGESPLIVDDDQDRGSFLVAIALRYAQKGQLSQAQQIAQSLENQALRQQLTQQISCYR